MEIFCFEFGAMTYNDIIPIGIGMTRGPYLTRPGRENRCADRCNVVDSPVGHCAIPQRMDAPHIKVGAYAGEFQGRPQERFLHTFAVGVEVPSYTFPIHVPKRQVTITLIHKSCSEDVSVADKITS